MQYDTSFRPLSRRWLIAGTLVAALLCVIGWSRTREKVANDPRVIYLAPSHGADWIHVGRPSSLGVMGRTELIHEFRKSFTVEQPIREPMLTFQALTEAAVYLDGTHVYSSTGDGNNWKLPHTVALTPELRPGTHELRFAVRSRNGAVALIVWCEALRLVTNDDWEAREGFTPDLAMHGKASEPWTTAARTDDVSPTELSREFPTTPQAFKASLSLLVPLFLVVVVAQLFLDRRTEQPVPWRQFLGSPATWRWILLLACAVLWINNIFKVPLYVGFDVDAHVEYIEYVADNWTIPYAGDGWQMFQSPLYYIVSAIFMKVVGPFVDAKAMPILLRLIPLACSLAQIEICYRALKVVFPERLNAQRLGLLIGGLLPMNLYISNYVGNETMAGCFSALVVLLVLQCLIDPSAIRSKKRLVWLGIALGLALLSKVTAVLLMPSVFLALAVAATNVESRMTRRVAPLFTVFGVTAIVAGWYYLRNWIHLGTPFLGGWDSERGIVWWQDPGYRVFRDFVSFSEALLQPINSTFYGFWDGLYSTLWLDGHLSSMDKIHEVPPWNRTLLLTAPWLAILPTIAILVGLTGSLWDKSWQVRRALLLCGCCLGVYLAAMLQLTLVVPTYSTVKATYTLGIIPCYAVLAAAGLNLACRNRLTKAIAYGWVVTFAVVVYATYFVV